jgi:hypothetical protein
MRRKKKVVTDVFKIFQSWKGLHIVVLKVGGVRNIFFSIYGLFLNKNTLFWLWKTVNFLKVGKEVSVMVWVCDWGRDKY